MIRPRLAPRYLVAAALPASCLLVVLALEPAIARVSPFFLFYAAVVVELRHGMVEYELARRTTAPPARGAYAHVWNFPVPLAAPGAALLCVTLVLIRWHRRLRQRDGAGLCRGCGYDLRATPERCPECGTIPAGNSP